MMKKEKKQNRSKSIFKRFDFPSLSNVSGTFRVVSHLDSEVLLVYGLFAMIFARLVVRAPIPYVQDAILNLRHPYIVIAV